jgi:hypothetical protein
VKHLSTASTLALTVIIAASCAVRTSTEVVTEYAVSGVVTAGPTCPVATDPPDPNCADRPVPGARLAILDAGGKHVGDLTADQNGEFTIGLPAGSYRLVPQPVEGLLGTAAEQTFEVGQSVHVTLTVVYDTGIR